MGIKLTPSMVLEGPGVKLAIVDEDQSKLFQEKAFSLGLTWYDGIKTIIVRRAGYIVVDSGVLRKCFSYSDYLQKPATEILLSDFMALETPVRRMTLPEIELALGYKIQLRGEERILVKYGKWDSLNSDQKAEVETVLNDYYTDEKTPAETYDRLLKLIMDEEQKPTTTRGLLLSRPKENA